MKKLIILLTAVFFVASCSSNIGDPGVSIVNVDKNDTVSSPYTLVTVQIVSIQPRREFTCGGPGGPIDLGWLGTTWVDICHYNDGSLANLSFQYATNGH